jgi:hypothetical protein
MQGIRTESALRASPSAKKRVCAFVVCVCITCTLKSSCLYLRLLLLAPLAPCVVYSYKCHATVSVNSLLGCAAHPAAYVLPVCVAQIMLAGVSGAVNWQTMAHIRCTHVA